MRLRNIPGARDAIADSIYTVKEPEKQKGHWSELFGNEHDLFIEIGMGKGRFITELAAIHPENNYIGIEKFSSVMLRAVQKQDVAQLPNLLFIRMEAEIITEVFAPGEVSGIFLNFSDPWPKEKHAKRRLPSREFLRRYDSILRKDGKVEFKTDNVELFNFALEEIEPAGWTLDKSTYDLHNDETMSIGNVMTEYEERFSNKGNCICKYVISRTRKAITD